MLSGGKAGLVSLQDLRKEQEENRRIEKKQPVEGLFTFAFLMFSFYIYSPASPHSSDLHPFLHVEESRHAQTVFRDKTGRKRNLDTEKEEQRKKDEEKAAKDEKYAQWGKGFVWKPFTHFDLIF